MPGFQIIKPMPELSQLVGRVRRFETSLRRLTRKAWPATTWVN